MGSQETPSHFKFKCITNTKQVKQHNKIVLYVSFDVDIGFH